jgi:hypothetical protein
MGRLHLDEFIRRLLLRLLPKGVHRGSLPAPISRQSRRLCCPARPAQPPPHHCYRGSSRAAAIQTGGRLQGGSTRREPDHLCKVPTFSLRCARPTPAAMSSAQSRRINEPTGRWYCQRGLPKCTLHAPASLAHTAEVALFQHRPHLDGRREIQIAIAPAAQPALKLPRLSALALFRRQLARFMLRPRNLPTGAIKMVRNPARPRPGSGGGYRGHPSRERAPLRRPAG